MEGRGIETRRDWTAVGLWTLAGCLLWCPMLVADEGCLKGELAGQWLWADWMMLAGGALLAAGAVTVGKERMLHLLEYACSLSLMIGGGVETVWGLCQLYGGAASLHAGYVMTGTFFNPGPYGGYVAMILPVCLACRLKHAMPWKELSVEARIEKAVATATGLGIICVLPASMSRSGWIAAAVSCLWVYGHYHRWGARIGKQWRERRKRTMAAVAAGMAGVLLLAAGVFALKPDSARGRFFMWYITGRAIAERPWTGYGTDGFAAAYGEAQEHYFARQAYLPWQERVAGSPEYAFNEYLHVAMERGIPVAVVWVATACLALWNSRRRGMMAVTGALISFLCFAFSSYPLAFPTFILTFAGLLSVALLPGRRLYWMGIGLLLVSVGFVRLDGDGERVKRAHMAARAGMLYRSGAFQAAAEAYEELCGEGRGQGRWLFEYGHSLHRLKRYEESNRVMEQALKRSNDPMILNVMGKNCQLTGHYQEAEALFRRAIHRLPGRIYPYYLLAKLYAEPDVADEEKFEEMRRTVREKEPKVMSTAVLEMRDELERMEIKTINKSRDNE